MEYTYTLKYMHSYGNKVVVAIKNRIRRDKLIDTGDLLDSIDYDVIQKGGSFQVQFRIGDGEFVHGSGLPSEYGVYQDQGTVYIDPHYFFTAPVPGLTAADFARDLKAAMTKDMEVAIRKSVK